MKEVDAKSPTLNLGFLGIMRDSWGFSGILKLGFVLLGIFYGLGSHGMKITIKPTTICWRICLGHFFLLHL